MLWVYSLFLASSAVFAWIKELFWISQTPSCWLCWQNSPFSSTVVRSWPLNFKAKSACTPIAIFSADRDDKFANVSIQLSRWNIFNFPVLVFHFQRSFKQSYISFSFWAVFLFSCSNINFSTEQTEVNLPSAIFQSAQPFVQRLTVDVLFSTFIHHQWNFVVRFADWTNDFLRWDFVFRAPDWLRTESVRILFTLIFMDKSQYLWNKPGFATEFRTREGLKGVSVGAYIKK